MELSSSKKETVCHQFDNFCKRLLKNEARDCFREKKRKKKVEVLFSEMTQNEIDDLITMDKYDFCLHRFKTCGFEIEIENDLLAEALLTLTEQNRNILLLSYFEDMSDIEIATALHMVRRTVQHRRTSSLVKLNKYMGGKTNAAE